MSRNIKTIWKFLGPPGELKEEIEWCIDNGFEVSIYPAIGESHGLANRPDDKHLYRGRSVSIYLPPGDPKESILMLRFTDQIWRSGLIG
jgi:hypothetical protein